MYYKHDFINSTNWHQHINPPCWTQVGRVSYMLGGTKQFTHFWTIHVHCTFQCPMHLLVLSHVLLTRRPWWLWQLRCRPLGILITRHSNWLPHPRARNQEFKINLVRIYFQTIITCKWQQILQTSISLKINLIY